SITPPTATTTPKMIAAAKGKQLAKAKSPSDPSEVARTEAQQLKIVLRRSIQQTHMSQPGGFGLNVNEEEHVKEEEEDELYRDVSINQGRGLQATLKVEDTHVTLTLINSDGQQESSSVSS
nr:hypothetical protein [Tanacetum cinerariifolium]